MKQFRNFKYAGIRSILRPVLNCPNLHQMGIGFASNCTLRRIKKMKILILIFYHPYFHVKSYYKNFGKNDFFQKLRFPLRFCRLKSLSPLYKTEKKVLQSMACGYSKLVSQGA